MVAALLGAFLSPARDKQNPSRIATCLSGFRAQVPYCSKNSQKGAGSGGRNGGFPGECSQIARLESKVLSNPSDSPRRLRHPSEQPCIAYFRKSTPIRGSQRPAAPYPRTQTARHQSLEPKQQIGRGPADQGRQGTRGVAIRRVQKPGRRRRRSRDRGNGVAGAPGPCYAAGLRHLPLPSRQAW